MFIASSLFLTLRHRLKRRIAAIYDVSLIFYLVHVTQPHNTLFVDDAKYNLLLLNC